MSITVESLRKFRNTSFAKISEGMKNVASPNKSYKDDRFWKLEADKVGNGSATIRFLSDPSKDSLPWVRVYSHGFKGPGGRWYIDECPTTINEPCPVCEANSTLFNSGIEKDKMLGRERKRRTHFIANILVVSDPTHPENNGRVFLYKFGKKIFDKAMDAMNPTFDDEEPINVFDLWAGADFKLRMRKVENFPNYDQSVFLDSSPVASSDEGIVEVVNSMIDLSEFTDPKNFKSYEEYSRKMNTVLSGSQTRAADLDEDIPFESDSSATKVTPKATRVASPPDEDDDDADTLAYFKKIAAGD